MESLESKIAQNFASLRTQAGLSKSFLATALDCNRKIIEQLESDVSQVRLVFFIRAVEFYGVPWNHIVGDDKTSDLNKVRWAVHQFQNRLSVTEQNCVIGLVEKAHEGRGGPGYWDRIKSRHKKPTKN